jgi:serine/threonine-protein kinase
MLTGGAKLGTYEVTSLIGSGGMGEVYQAHDNKLGRDVAIKVLPEQFARDPERLARFQREAKLLASLNHPNIATIHGLEQSGSTHYLVMELVPGETLRDRIAREGPVPVEEALTIAKQIAEALEAAHGSEKAIIHRDLKPANVKVTPEGRVKVLDFGLAKAFATDTSTEDPSNSPTLSMNPTQQGVIMGTAAYMSPEQARGKTVTKATDIFAFGSVLYELLTGKQAFQGDDIGDILATVVKVEPDWSKLPADTPPNIRILLKRCLRKDRQQRLADAGAVRIEIEDALSGTVPADVEVTVAPQRKSRERMAWVTAVFLALVAVALGIGFVLRRAPQLPQQTHVSADIGADASLTVSIGASAVISPDGTRLAFVASGTDQISRLYVRPLDQLRATVLSGTDLARDPFFSPDGQWIGFFAGGKLKKISFQGGAAVTLCDAPNGRGGSWGGDGNIVFTAGQTGPLSLVSSAGGTPQALTTLDAQAGEVTHRWPQILPGGGAVLFVASSAQGNYRDADIVVYSIASRQRKTIHRGGFYARYAPSGHVVYAHEGTLFALPFDLQRLEVTGEPAPVLEEVMTAPNAAGAQYSFSDTGNMVYVAGRAGGQTVSVFWMDHEGKFTRLRETLGDYRNPAFSPDGKRLALEISDGTRGDIWVYEWERDSLTRLTFAGNTNAFPLWTPDGQGIVYASQEQGGAYNLWWMRADGGGDPQRLTESRNNQRATSWRPDGKVLAFRQASPEATYDLLTLPIERNGTSGLKPGEPQPFLSGSFILDWPAFSPDGRWLAYHSVESGISEVYVRPFLGAGGKWQISTGGGGYPRWSRNGRDLFYRTPDNRIMVVTYAASGNSFRADRPQLWSPGQLGLRPGGVSNYDLHPDGNRFAVLKAPETEENTAANRVNIVLNWFEELRRLVPTGN